MTNAQDSVSSYIDAQRCQGLGRQVAAHTHAVVPAGKEEIHIGIEQRFNGRVLARQFGQAVEDHLHLRGDGLPAADAAVTGHVRLQPEGQHHVRHVDVMTDGMLGVSLKVITSRSQLGIVRRVASAWAS